MSKPFQWAGTHDSPHKYCACCSIPLADAFPACLIQNQVCTTNGSSAESDTQVIKNAEQSNTLQMLYSTAQLHKDCRSLYSPQYISRHEAELPPWIKRNETFHVSIYRGDIVNGFFQAFGAAGADMLNS